MKTVMKKGKQIEALLLSMLLLLAVFTGCSSSGTESSETTKSSTSEKAGDGSGTEEQQEESAENTGEFKLPITEEKTTITVFTRNDANLSNIVDNFNETYFFQELEKRTNIHIDFDIPAVGNESQAFNLLIASDELPDMIANQRPGYPGGLDAAIDDGYYLDLTDLVPKYAPHYYEVMKSWEDIDLTAYKSAFTGSGRIGALGMFYTEPQGPWAGLYVREDWLEKCGLDVPQTYEDWEVMLTAFKDEMGATTPLLLGKNGYDNIYNVLSIGFGVTSSWYNNDGVVKFGPAQEGWKEYVTLLHDWYEKGLIDPDFMSSTAPFMIEPDTSLITTNKAGATAGVYTNISAWEEGCTDPDANFIPVYPPMPTAGMKHDFQNMSPPTASATNGLSISADSENAEICLRLIDYFFTEEGEIFCNYGVEGDTFTYDAAGDPQYTEKLTDNDQMSFAQALAYYTMPPARVSWQNWRRELVLLPEEDTICYDIWGAGTNKNSLPMVEAMNMEPDDYSEYSKLMADIQTTVDEMTPQFISGVLSMDEYDTYLERLDSMGVDRATEIVQKTYTKFME